MTGRSEIGEGVFKGLEPTRLFSLDRLGGGARRFDWPSTIAIDYRRPILILEVCP